MNAKVTTNTISFKGLRLISGQTGLDLLNTVKYRASSDNGDRFTTFSDIVEWALLVKIINKKEYKILASQNDHEDNLQVFQQVSAFRENVRVLFNRPKCFEHEFAKASKYVEKNIAKLRPSIIIDTKTGVLEKSYPLKTPQDLKFRIVACISDLLQNRDLLTIKQCSGADCDWLFSDETKAKRRKWCDTRTCGNLARVRKHREI